MLEKKLTIIPVTLNPITDESSSISSLHSFPSPSCVIKTAGAEIAIFNGVDERIIHTIMKGLNKL